MTDVVQLLRDLVALPSVNPCAGEPDDVHGEGRVVEHLVGWLEQRKIDHELQEVWPGRHNVLARLSGGAGPSVVFEAHTDTVEIQNMEIEPFAPDLREGRVYGRGSCDDKASLAAMLVALERTKQRGTPPGDITLAATVDEEYRFSGVKYMTDHGFRADGAVVGEPTKLQLIVAHKGALRSQIITHGKAWHSSEPDKGESAIFHMARVLTAIEDYGRELAKRPRHPLVNGPTISVGQINGGHAPNIVPDRCEIAIDRRIMPGEVPEVVEQELRDWLTGRLEGVPWEMYIRLNDGGLEGSPDAPIAQRCAAALDRVLGGHVTAGVQYGTDASKFAAAGTPAVVLGPGDIAQAHTAVEWVDVEQVKTAVEVYAEIMWPR
ncbi:MAG: M20 family metallopeptidase [Armatimonadia bacterium]